MSTAANTWRRRLVLLGLACAVAACGGPAVDVRGVLTRAAIDGSALPLMLAEIVQQDLSATLVPAGRRDGIDTWRTGQNQTLSLQDGVLIATRGLGDDLMSADASGTRAALSGGRQTGYPRLMTYLDGEGQTVFRTMLCDMSAPVAATVQSFGLSFATSRRTETCATTGRTVQNHYWQNPDGSMRRSEIWIGPGLGTLAIEWLSR